MELWGAAVKSHIQPIQILQKRAIRFITSSTYNSSTHNYFKDLKILKIQDLYQVQLLTQMYKAFKGVLSPLIQLNYTKPPSERLTRQTLWNLNVRMKSTKIQNSRPSVAGPFLWNSLNQNIKQAKTLKKFKKILTTDILKHY